MRFLIILFLVAIIVSLASALVAMLRGGEKNSKRMFNALLMRVLLSVILFALLIFAFFFGWIEPHGFGGRMMHHW